MDREPGCIGRWQTGVSLGALIAFGTIGAACASNEVADPGEVGTVVQALETSSADLSIAPGPFLPPSFQVGSPGYLSVSVRNNGPSSAPHTVGVVDVTGDVTVGWAGGSLFFPVSCVVTRTSPLSSRVTCASSFTFPSNFGGSIHITVTPNSAGPVRFQAQVSSDLADPNPDNNSFDLTVPAVMPPMADLAVSLAGAPDPVVYKKELTYTMTVTNEGPDPATDVFATQTIPLAAGFRSSQSTHGECFGGESGFLTCWVGSLDVGESATVTLVVTPLEGGTFESSAAVSGSQRDPDIENNQALAVTTVRGPNPPTNTTSLQEHLPVSMPWYPWVWVPCLADYVVFDGLMHHSAQAVSNEARGSFRYHWETNYPTVTATSLTEQEVFRVRGGSRGRETWGEPWPASHTYQSSFVLVGERSGLEIPVRQAFEVWFDAGGIAGATVMETVAECEAVCPNAGSWCVTGQAGMCEFGTVVCENATEHCAAWYSPSPEICNSVDDDCDGEIDEELPPEACSVDCPYGSADCDADGLMCEVDLISDINNCGACGSVCTAINAVAYCDRGACMFTCAFGFSDLDGDATNGCEAEADPGLQSEICNGLDDDADGFIDEEILGRPCGSPDGLCAPGVTICMNARETCQCGT